MTHSDELEFEDKATKDGEPFAKRRQRHQARLRKKVRERDVACVGCGASDNLQAAHLVPVTELIRDMDLQAAHDPRIAACLCRRCHIVFDGAQILPEDSEEMNHLLDIRHDRATEHLGREPDRMDMELLARSDERIRHINEQMRRLLERARAHHAYVEARMIKHLARIVLQVEASTQEIDPGLRIDVMYRIVDDIFADFVSRHQFFAIEKEHKEFAHRGRLHFSWRLRLWYGPKELNLCHIAQNERAREIRDIPAWQQSLREREQRQRQERNRILQEKAGKKQDTKDAMQRAILASMSTQPTTIREIARATGLTYSQIHNEIYPNSLSLCAQGLVERHVGHGGRSSAIAYSLTAKGALLVEAINDKEDSTR